MRVVPLREVVAYLQHVGALQMYARAAVAVTDRAVPSAPPAAPAGRPSVGAPSRARLGFLTHLERRVTSYLATLRSWFHRVLRALVTMFAAVLCVCILHVSIVTAAAGQPSGSERPSGPDRSAQSPFRLEALERDVARLPMPELRRGPVTLVVVSEPDLRLVGFAAAVSMLSLILGFLLLLQSGVGRRARARWRPTLRAMRCRLRKTPMDPDVAPKEKEESEQLAQETVPGYETTLVAEEDSDPLVGCWLARIDDALARYGASMKSMPWSTAISSHRGHVRTKNEDFGLTFTLQGFDVLVVADGCGGVPHGHQASRIAVCAAVVHLARELVGQAGHDAARVEAAVRTTFAEASRHLADAVKVYPMSGDQPVLQTTLMIGIGSADRLTLGYIGDGGAVLVRAHDGSEMRLLQPMKADGMAPNVLAAVLGPQMLGEPKVATVDRRCGDLVVMGTDGVFDYVDETFVKQLVRELVQCRGGIRQALEAALDQLAQYQDEHGYVCSDNLTLGVLAIDRSRPAFGAGYWAVPGRSEGTSADEVGQPVLGGLAQC